MKLLQILLFSLICQQECHSYLDLVIVPVKSLQTLLDSWRLALEIDSDLYLNLGHPSSRYALGLFWPSSNFSPFSCGASCES